MHSLLLILHLPSTYEQIYAIRGAFGDYAQKLWKAGQLTKEEGQYFTNHDFDTGKPIQRYPKIQYRIRGEFAAIWGMDEGAEAIRKIISPQNSIEGFSILGNENLSIQITETEKTETLLPKYTTEWHEYLIHHFIPFNDEKFKEYERLETYIEKIQLLEQLLLNELVLFSYAANWKLSKKEILRIDITDIMDRGRTIFKTKNKKGEKETLYLWHYFLKFRTNAELPEGISLGRHKGYGKGVVTRSVRLDIR